jgi:hypothetical protein
VGRARAQQRVDGDVLDRTGPGDHAQHEAILADAAEEAGGVAVAPRRAPRAAAGCPRSRSARGARRSRRAPRRLRCRPS